jgi:hypothetical protein
LLLASSCRCSPPIAALLSKSLHLPELNLLQPTAVGEFWQSRFATAPLAFSGNRAFWSRGLLAFQLNHAARLVDGTEVFILGLYYREGDVTDAALCRPELRVRCGKYMRAADAGKWLNGAEEAPSLDDDALVFVDNKMDLPPEVFDMPLDGDDCPSALWMYDDEHGWREGSPAELLLRYPALQPGEVRLSLDLFVDAFSARSSRAHSITAVYLTVNNMLLEERMRDENIIIAALGSPKVSPPEVRRKCLGRLPLTLSLSLYVLLCSCWRSSGRTCGAWRMESS